MSSPLLRQLSDVLGKINRPGSFCVSGSAPVVLPGLEVEGLGPIGLPLTVKQAKELKKHCEQAPYGKGEKTIVDKNVRRVWEMKPERFSLTNPEWEAFLGQTVKQIQQELGLENQKLDSHLYDLLLYEKGSFFLPHRDGEKLDRMVATLVVVLPSAFQGGELVVRHEGQEKTIDFGSGEGNPFRIHFAAFYADCEHEVRPLREGYRLCLVYNLTLKKGKKGLSAPRSLETIEEASRILGEWAKDPAARRVAVTLEHQYTQEGLTWDALKGVDRVKARVLLEAAQQAGCQAHLALLTLHESGAAEGGYGYGRSRGRYSRWYEEEEEDPGDYTMGEIYETTLTAEHWTDRNGKKLPLGTIHIKEDELLEPDLLREVDPEEEFEGYTGNAGMTLDRWYRHAAIFLWPNQRHFDILCDAGSGKASEALKLIVNQLPHAPAKNAAALREQCLAFASAIMARWKEKPYVGRYGEQAEPCPLLQSLVALDEPGLIKTYLRQVLLRDASIDPGKSLLQVCQKHGWKAFQPEIESVFQATTGETIERNVRLLEQFCLAKPRKKEGWTELCRSLARILVQALEGVDRDKAERDFHAREVKRSEVLAGLARSLIASDQFDLLSQVVDHALARPEKYPVTTIHVKALTTLQPWLKSNVKKPCPPLSRWIAACCEQLESLTGKEPQAPTDFRRPSAIACKCADCAELRRFLDDPKEKEHRFRIGESRRRHLETRIRENNCDLDCKTDRQGSPHTLVCTKNTRSYQERLMKYRQEKTYLQTLRSSILASLPK